MAVSTFFAAMVALYTGIAAVIDYREHRIPNYLTVPAAILGLVFHAFVPGAWGLPFALAGFAVGFALLILPWLLGGGGMGDVKLLAALGAWLGPWLVLAAFAGSAVLGSLMAMSVMAFHGTTRGMGYARQRYLGGAAAQAAPRRVRVLPFAVPVAISTWCLLAWLLARGVL